MPLFLFPWGYDPRFITSRTFVFRKTPGDKTLVTLDYFIGRRYYLDDRRSFVIKNATKISYEESEVVDEAIEENNICKVYWYNRGFATTYAEDTKSLFKNIQYTGEDIRVTWSDNSATLFRRSEEKEWQAENVYPPDLRYYKKCRLYTNNSLTDKNIMFVFSGTYMRKKTQTIIRNGEWRSYKSVITNDKNEYISDGGDVIVYVPEETGDGYVEKKIATLDLFYKYKVVEEPCGVMWHIQNATEIYTNHLIDSSCAIDTHKLADNATVSATIIRALHMYNCQFNGYVDARTYDNESYKGTVCNSIVSTEDVRFRPIIGSNYIYGCTVQNAIINQSSEYKHLYELRNSDIRNSVFAVRPDTVTNCHIIQNDYDTPWTATSVGLQINKLIDSTIIVNMPKEEFTDFRGVMISGLASNSTVYLNGSMEFKKRYSDNTYYATYLQKNVAVSNLTSYNNVLITLVEPENEEWLNCAVTYCCDIAQVTPTDQTKCIVGCRMYKSGTLCTNISCDDM